MEPSSHSTEEETEAGEVKWLSSSLMGKPALKHESLYSSSTISWSALDKNPIPGHLFECKPVDEVTTRRGTDTPVHHPEKTAGSKYSSTSGLSPREHLDRQVEFHASTQDEA